MIIHQLEQIPVSGEDAHAPALISGTVGQGAEHIIGFVTRCEAERQLQLIAQDLLQLLQVLKEHLRSDIAVGLVVGISLMAEGRLGGVEGDGHALWLERFARVQQRFEEPVGDAGRAPVLGGQAPFASLAEGIEAAKRQGMAVHKQQQGLWSGLRHGRSGGNGSQSRRSAHGGRSMNTRSPGSRPFRIAVWSPLLLPSSTS